MSDAAHGEKRARDDVVAGVAPPAASQAAPVPPAATAAAVAAAADDDDDLDVPLHKLAAAVKPKQPATGIAAAPSAKKSKTANGKAVAKPAAKPAAVKKEAALSSDDEPLVKAKPAAKPKPAVSASKPKPAASKATRKDDDDNDDDGDFKKSAKKATPKKRDAAADSSSEDVPLSKVAATKKVKKAAAPRKTGEAGSGKRVKKEEEPVDVWEWWNEPPLPAGKKWRTLVHNGVIFPPDYVPLPGNVKMLYDGHPIALNAEAEERAMHYSRYLATPHVQKEAFRKNFFAEFKEVANKNRVAGAPKLEKLDLCDFSPIKAYLDAEKDRKKQRTSEEKAREKADKKALQDQYGWCVLDGHRQKVGNFMVEPPGLFLGRGAHPKTGTWKRRLTPADITLNIGEGAPVPPCPIAGQSWGKIVHKDTVTWLAGWQEGVQDAFKYVMLSASSRTKGQSDMAKFEKARRLQFNIEKIREAYTKEFDSSDVLERQRAVIIYLIDKLALRVGGEKDTKNTADTVGCCSLRVEHVTFRAPATVTLDFLGKDSMRFYSSVEVLPAVYRNMTAFAVGKKATEQLFDRVNPSILNDHLKTFMDGLSAKVFRTYNASITLERELAKTPADASIEEKVAYYNKANKQVALLCNHKRTVPAKFAEGLKKLEDQIAALEADVQELETHRKLLKDGKKPLKREKDEYGEDKPPLPTDIDKVDSKLEALQERLHKQRVAKVDKEENSEVALGTSKINYNDPRITAAWCKKFDVPWGKVFSLTLRAKFPWAQMADAEWTFQTDDPVLRAAAEAESAQRVTRTPKASAKKGGSAKKKGGSKRRSRRRDSDDDDDDDDDDNDDGADDDDDEDDDE